jgi:hypothetical protein
MVNRAVFVATLANSLSGNMFAGRFNPKHI